MTNNIPRISDSLRRLQTDNGDFPPTQEALEIIWACLTDILVILAHS